MIYYPLSVLLLAGIRDILIISTPKDISRFEELLGDGSFIGINISYKVQDEPRGIAEAFIIGKDFIGNEGVVLILGDNIFYGHGIGDLLNNAKNNLKHNFATVFGYYVSDPQRYGVVEFDKNGDVVSIEEKPKQPKSNFAVVGLYFYPSDVVKIAANLKPSWRGELEITDVNKEYLFQKRLKVEIMGRGYAWLDTGTHESLIEASIFIQTIEKRQGLKIGCIEEISYRKGYISKEKLIELSKKYKNSYGEYLLRISSEK
jgi:glucose-1-phosphate thymidylyltransferase